MDWSVSKREYVSMQPADIYLVDEPSAYLDSEQRLIAAKVIKRSVHLENYCSVHSPLLQQVYPSRQEDGIRSRARFYHGHLPGR